MPSISVDLMDLKANCSTKKWNAYLTRCLKNKSIDELLQMRQRLQRGMNNLVKQKMNTEEMNLWFIRLQRSTEVTLRKIWKEKHFNPNYNPATAQGEYVLEKRRLDNEFEIMLRKNSY